MDRFRSTGSRWIALAAVALVAASVPAPAAADQRGDALAPTSLRANGQAADVLVGSPPLTLDWSVNDKGRGEKQTAYEITVDGPRGHWSSGRVSSSKSVDVAYSGPPLVSDRTYTWSVRTWNSRGSRSPWSTPARFDTGLLAPSDWSAWWTQVEDGSLVRGDFDVTKPVARARLYFGAQGVVEPHVNGARVEPEQVLDSSVTDYAARVLYRELDVTGLLRSGRNTLAFMADRGQFSGRPVFVAQLTTTYTDGSTATFGTNPDWRTHAGPVVGTDFYYGETYDARQEIAGWDAVGLDTSTWSPVRTVAPASHRQSLAQGKPVTALDTITCCGWSPAATTDGVDGSSDASEGYHSALDPNPDTTKWVQVDLGSAQRIRSVSLFPARPTNDTAGDIVGAGFPVRYRVEVSDDPSFAGSTAVADRTGADQPNPGTGHVDLPADVTGRYVRVTATKLSCTGAGCSLRFAEIGVHGDRPATVHSGLTRLEADSTPPVRVVGTTAPVRETRPAPGVRVFDFGQNRTGQVTLTATQPAGTTAVVKKGEILDPDGRVTTANISFGPGEPPRQTDRYTFAGSGAETYTPHFDYAGFRYAELTGLPDDAAVTVAAQEIHNDVPSAGTFSTSDPLLNRIQGAVRQTQLNNLVSMPLDCPTREKHGWLGDAGDTDQEAMSNFDMRSFYDKWLGDVATSAYADGSIPSVAPINGDNGWRPDPAWASAYPQVVWDSYTRYGNKDLLTTHYAKIKAWVDYLATISDADHVVVNAPMSWGDDWVSIVSTPHQYFHTGFYHLDAVLLAKMAAAIGKTDDAKRYDALAKDVLAGFTKRFLDPGTGVYATGTQLSYALPLAFDMVPPDREKSTVDKLVADIAARGYHLSTGFVGTVLVFQALGKHDRNDVALAVAQRTDYPGFGYMLDNGPGTIWEKWDNSSAPDGTSSKDHIGLGGAVGQWFYEHLAGIQPGDGAAYGSFTLAPAVVGDLTRASAEQKTVRGTVTSSWERTGSTLTYRATVPVGSTATIRLPLLGGKRSTVREGGRTIFGEGHPVQRVPGLRTGAVDDQALTLTAGSGEYSFTVTPPRTPFTSVSISAGSTNPITSGGSGDIPVAVHGRSTADSAVAVTAEVPAGWTATTAKVALTPATTSTTANVRVTVPAGAKSGLYPVTVTAKAPNTPPTRTTVTIAVFGAWQAGTTAAGSTEHAPNTVNGAVRTYVAANAPDRDPATFWNDDTADVFPDSLTVTAPAPTPLTGTGLVSHQDGVVTDFTVETWDGANWVVRAEVRGNNEVNRWIPFASPVTTTRVRVTVTSARNAHSRIAELTP
ncbi:MAG TPA: family 78 glycoside hydrolase catalytic domain [Umezawaea sp.]|nr:family 78 glycoside hydrolase catalytic domain [Umezawaea sp.]